MLINTDYIRYARNRRRVPFGLIRMSPVGTFKFSLDWSLCNYKDNFSKKRAKVEANQKTPVTFDLQCEDSILNAAVTLPIKLHKDFLKMVNDLQRLCAYKSSFQQVFRSAKERVENLRN